MGDGFRQQAFELAEVIDLGADVIEVACGDLPDFTARGFFRTAEPQHSRRGTTLMAAVSLLAALTASSCCILPVVLFSLGISGAWIGNFTQLAPYQPYFFAATSVFLGTGYWLVYRASKLACSEGDACARPLRNRLVRIVLAVATVLVVAAFGFDIPAPLLLNS